MYQPKLDFNPTFSIERLCYSDTAKRECIDNACPGPLLPNLAKLSVLLGDIERQLNCKLRINSAFRCHALNERVGGVSNSQHTLGLAADIVSDDFESAYALALAIAETNLAFDQLILEFGRWVHISVCAQGDNPRGETLTIHNKAQGYVEGIVS